MSVVKDGGAGTFTGTVSGNTIGALEVANSGSRLGSGISVLWAGTGSHTVVIRNNLVRQYNVAGISARAGGALIGSGALNATVQGNTVTEPGATSRATNVGVTVAAGALSGDSYQVCAGVGGGGGAACPLPPQ